TWPAGKIAVNSRGCNTANRSIFAIEYSRNHPGIVSVSPHEIFVWSHRNAKRRPRSFVRERTGEVWGCHRGSSMRQLFAFRRSLRFIGLALCSVSIVAFVSPASARAHHGARRHARAYHAGHHAKHHYAYRHHRRSAPQMQAGGFADTNPSFMESSPQMVAPGGFGAPNVATEARAGRRSARLRQVEHNTSRWERGVAQMQASGLANANASVAADTGVGS